MAAWTACQLDKQLAGFRRFLKTVTYLDSSWVAGQDNTYERLGECSFWYLAKTKQEDFRQNWHLVPLDDFLLLDDDPLALLVPGIGRICRI